MKILPRRFTACARISRSFSWKAPGEMNRKSASPTWAPSCLEQPTTLTEYDEPLVRRLIEKVTVYSGKQVAADKSTVEFKSGVTVDVDG